MFGLIVISVIIGLIVSGITGFGFAGIAVGIFFFVCGLPFALIGLFVHEEVSYAQDRADMRAIERELAEDMRTDHLIETMEKNPPKVFQDNRQVHIHGRINGN